MDTILGRKLLDYATEHPELLDRRTWGSPVPQVGIFACLAGRALLLSGEYTLTGHERFAGEDGNAVPVSAIPGIAQELLGLTEDEARTLFADQPEGVAVAWLREFVENAEMDNALPDHNGPDWGVPRG